MNVGDRRTVLARWAGVLLVAAALPLAGPAPVAQAEPGCTTEEAPGGLPPDYGCDDTTPPDTVISGLSPQPNGGGWTRTSQATLSYSAVATDGDSGPWGFMCKLDGPSQSHDWQECASPTSQSYSGLADGTYTFSVYAVDEGDSGHWLGNPLDPFDDEDTSVPDDDSATPATRTWKQDTVEPSVVVFGGPYDSQGTGLPLARNPKVRYVLDSEDGVRYRCYLDGRAQECGEGAVTFSDVRGGVHTFTAEVVDRAGNRSSRVDRSFLMPYDLGRAAGWQRRTGKGYFDRDVMVTDRPGAQLTMPGRNVRGLVLIAPSGPRLGKVRVRIGDGVFRTVDLGAKPARAQRHYVIRSKFMALVSGRIVIEALVGKPVRVDAVYFPVD